MPLHVFTSLATALRRPRRTWLFGLAGASVAASAQQQLPRVEVTGADRPRVSAAKVTEDVEAAPASTTVLDRRDLDRLSISTYGDIFRGLTGVFVNDYGQGLVAYEIKMRGFQSGHGRDIAFSLDGVPLNITGSQHTNGYADLALVIPETVDRVELVRGPFSVSAGNHAVSGAVNFFTDRNTPSMLKLDIDSFGRVRAVPVLNTALGEGRLLLALDATKGSAYADQTDLSRTNVFARYSLAVGGGQASLRLQHYDADAEAPGYLDLAKVKDGSISPKAALSPGIGDAKTQTNLVLNFRSDDLEGQSGLAGGWSASLYTVRDDRHRWTNYALDQPIGQAADLGAERDRLSQTGLDLRKTTMLGSAAMPAQLLLGLQLNHEGIDALNFASDAQRQPLGDETVNAQRQVTTRTTALFGQYQISPARGVKLQAGLRYDRIGFDIDLKPLDDAYGSTAGNHFGATKGQFSPKLGLAWAALEGETSVELFANAARGLKTPYPYGDYNRLPDSSISPLTSYEVGVQGTVGASRWRAALWKTSQDKEALFDSANRFIGNQRTSRDGIDLEGRHAVSGAMRLTANASVVRARLQGVGGSDRIPNVADWTAGLGIEGTVQAAAHRVEWSLTDSWVGPQPLLPDNSARTRAYQHITARAGYVHAALKGAKFALAVSFVDRPLEETVFDFGGGQYGVSPKPRVKVLLSGQYVF